MTEQLEIAEETVKHKKPKKAEPFTEEEFFSLTDLRQRKATINVCVLGEKRYNQETGELKTLTPDKEIQVSPDYWLNVHRTYKNNNDVIGKPTDPQRLVGYTLDGVYSEFKK